mgnify:CR=1 FL=1
MNNKLVIHKKDLKLIELPPAGLKDSIMKHIKNQDYLNFKVDAPNEIHSEFFNMNRDMNESVNESQTSLDFEKTESKKVVDIGWNIY